MKKNVINSVSVVVYLLLLKSLFEIGSKIWNREFSNWMASITNGELITLVAAIIGMLVISHKMRTSGKSHSIEEENRKHQFYRMVFILVFLVGTVTYNRDMFKVGMFDVNLFIIFAISIISILFIELIIKKNDRKNKNAKLDETKEDFEYIDER